MARLDLYRLPELDGYVLEVQANLLAGLATTVVIPLVPIDRSPKPLSGLNPVFQVSGQAFVLQTQSLSAISRKELGAPVTSLGEDKHYDLLNALNLLFTGA